MTEEVSKKFNKYLCLKNIRTLLGQNSNVKIGQIEQNAGVSLGYMSRLEKINNASEPNIKFIVTASKMLNVSMDVLLFVNLTALTPTERYLTKFIQKLNQDTIDDRLEWERETVDELERMEMDANGHIEHPLFSFETFIKQGETERLEKKNEIRFVSHSFGCNTYIAGDCYRLKMKDYSTLYIMNIGNANEVYTTAKEIWIDTPGMVSQFLMCNCDNSQLAGLVDTLYETIDEFIKHPKIKKDVKSVLDAFMDDDLGKNNDDVSFL